MKYPKYKLAFPGKHVIVFNCHPMTQFDGYTLGTYASGSGVVSASKQKGFWGESAELFQSAAQGYSFEGYSANKGTINGNTYIFGKGDDVVTAFFKESETDIYNLFLNQTQGGTISADKLTGHKGQSANLSYTANQDYYFNGWKTTGAPIVDNKLEFTQNTTAEANFINTSPAKYYNNPTTTRIQAKNASSGTFYQEYLYLDGPYYDHLDPKFLSTYSASIKDKNYFVLKYDMKREVGEGEYYWHCTGTNAGTVLHGWQDACSSFRHGFVPEIEDLLGGSRLSRKSDYQFSTCEEYLYDPNGTKTATDIRTTAIPSGTTWSAYKVPLRTYARHFNHGRLGLYTDVFSGYWIGRYTLNVNASGKWNYNGYCFEPTAYEDTDWRTVKLVFDMNNFAYSSYVGDECVYKQTNNLTWSATDDWMAQGPSKLYAIHNMNSFIQAPWSTQWNGTSSTYRQVGLVSAKNVSLTYFDNCEQANNWAKNN